MMIKEKESVDIIIRDLESNPNCQHGPTILFSSKIGKKYFSCSSNRTKDCFYLEYENFEKKDEIMSKISLIAKVNEFETVDLRKIKASERYFCATCNKFNPANLQDVHKSHSIKQVSDEMLKEPSLFLEQLDNDKVNAQYFFDNSTLNFIDKIFEDLKLSNIICMGAPRLHDHLRKSKSKKSILLDIDERFQPFYPDEFCLYNMFNNFFFNGQRDKDKLIDFLRNANDNDEYSQCCLFTDPPFAARTELLSQTIKTISSLYYSLHHKILPVFWIFPYFNEHHIQKFMPEMEMMDFRVTYMNHYAFNNEYKGRKEGSVVRMFTNIPQSLIKYPPTLVDYRFCKPCNRFVSKSNIHCNICKICPSKNGASYRHCDSCIKCVKKNYQHCINCGRCTQKTNHDCKIFQKYQECWFCHEKGHVEKYCSRMKNIKRKGKNGRCIVCSKTHNLSKCSEKNKKLKK